MRQGSSCESSRDAGHEAAKTIRSRSPRVHATTRRCGHLSSGLRRGKTHMMEQRSWRDKGAKHCSLFHRIAMAIPEAKNPPSNEIGGTAAMQGMFARDSHTIYAVRASSTQHKRKESACRIKYCVIRALKTLIRLFAVIGRRRLRALQCLPTTNPRWRTRFLARGFHCKCLLQHRRSHSPRPGSHPCWTTHLRGRCRTSCSSAGNDVVLAERLKVRASPRLIAQYLIAG